MTDPKDKTPVAHLGDVDLDDAESKIIQDVLALHGLADTPAAVRMVCMHALALGLGSLQAVTMSHAAMDAAGKVAAPHPDETRH